MIIILNYLFIVLLFILFLVAVPFQTAEGEVGRHVQRLGQDLEEAFRSRHYLEEQILDEGASRSCHLKLGLAALVEAFHEKEAQKVAC